MTAEDVRQVTEYLKAEVAGFATMVVAICATLLAQSGQLHFSTRTNAWIGITSTVAGIVAAYTIRPFRTRVPDRTPEPIERREGAGAVLIGHPQPSDEERARDEEHGVDFE